MTEAKAGHHRLGRGKGGLVATAHDGELPVLRPGLPARDRGIHKRYALLLDGGVQLPRQLGRGGGVVNQNTARLHARQSTIRPQHHAAHVVIVADAHEDDIGPWGCFARRAGMVRTACCRKGLHPGLRVGGRAVEHRDRVPGQRQMPRHGLAHYAQS